MIVAIPDFMHATAAMWCMERGKHVYVQKPLTRTVWEARQTAGSRQQIQSRHADGQPGLLERRHAAGGRNDLGRRNRQCHRSACLDRPAHLAAGPDRDSRRRSRCPPRSIGISGWASPKIARTPPAARITNRRLTGHFYQPFNWRGFYDFGCGALGDMACHILGAPNMALQLGAPTSVECIQKEGTSNFMFPKKSVIRFDFPARGNMPPVKVFWYDGLKETPKFDWRAGGRTAGRSARDSHAARLAIEDRRRPPGSSATSSITKSSRP